MTGITQNMRYRQSLMKYAEKYGVSCASRRYSKSRPYICLRKAHRDGSAESPACRSFFLSERFSKQLAARNRRSDSLLMRPLNRPSPKKFSVQYV